MALLQISEPGQSPAPHARKLAAGIDLGTTHSLVATVRSSKPEVLCDEQGDYLLPSVVQYGESGSVTVGSAAKITAAINPANTIASIKRLMGRGLSDVVHVGGQMPYEFVEAGSGMPKIRTDAGDISPVEVSAEILKSLRTRAQDSLAGELAGVVITVPAYFDDAQRQATRDAARLAGLNVLRLLNEPTAAAVAYGLDRRSEGIHAIYDLGGGTFDVSILRFSQGVFEVLASAGDSALGGDDFDRLLVNWLLDQIGVSGQELSRMEMRALQDKACELKVALTDQETVNIDINLDGGVSWVGAMSRDEFETMATSLVKKTLMPCRRALKDAGVSVDEIEEVVMVGGATRMPIVRKLVGEYFGRSPLVDIDPDQVVALGAAIQADILVGNKSSEELLLLDVIPLSLGLETMGGLVEKVVPRNTPIPVARAQEFTTYKDGQTAMSIHVVQGERELVSDCRSLARFVMQGIPAMAAGAAKIQVKFQVDADGLLSVTAKELTTGIESAIQVKPSYGLEDGEVERMLKESMTHAKEDVAKRMLVEQRVMADQMLETLQHALQIDGEKYLAPEEREKINDAVKQLHEVSQQENAQAIKIAIEALDQVSGEFAARRMNAGIQQALTGHKVDEF